MKPTLSLLAYRERREKEIRAEIADYLVGDFRIAAREGKPEVGYFQVGVSAVLEALETQRQRNLHLTLDEALSGIRSYLGELLKANLGEE